MLKSMLKKFHGILDPKIGFKNALIEHYQLDNKIEPLLKDDNEIESRNLEDQYINLEITLDSDNKSANNFKIDPSKFFTGGTGRVLVTGVAGVGKTTLMDYCRYMWGKKELWHDSTSSGYKFEFVVRVRLRELGNEKWKDNYKNHNGDGQSQIYIRPLICFIHYKLPPAIKKQVTVVQLEKYLHSDRTKTLLLVDGYDEVAHIFCNDSKYPDERLIKEQIFDFPNIIMTTRPGAVHIDILNKFQLKVYNLGLDDNGISKYINKEFETQDQELASSFKSFFDTHPDVRKMCQIPINLALICLVWKNAKIREELMTEALSLSRLYDYVSIRLFQKYLQKS